MLERGMSVAVAGELLSPSLQLLDTLPRKSNARNQVLPTALLWTIAAWSQSGCFFDEVINEEPVPGISALNPGLHYIGDILRFNATKSIDDGSELIAEWTAFACVEPGNCRRIAEISYKSVATEFEVIVATHETIEVQLRIVDSFGAVRLQPDLHSSPVSNRQPSIDMQIQGTRESSSGPFVLGLPIHFVGLSMSTNSSGESELLPVLLDLDGDTTVISWQLSPPPGSLTKTRVFEPEGETGQRLVPDVAGEWTILLRSEDAFGGSAERELTFFVAEDGPPCLEVLSPQAVDNAYYPLDSLDDPRRFSVLSVVDALDPFPLAPGASPVLGEASFRWLLRSPGDSEFSLVPGFTASSYLIDATRYQPGDRVELRVEVMDRVSGPERELACADNVGSCELRAGSECFQRKTWGVEIQ